MYKIDNKNLRAKIKNLEQRLDFPRYNIKEKQKEKGRKKKINKKDIKRIIKKQTNKKTIKKKKNKKKTINNHPKTVYGVCLKKKKKVFLKNKQKNIVIIGYRNENQRRNRRLNN